MAIPALPTWYHANLQYLLTSLNPIRQALAARITHIQNQPVPIFSETKLAPEALAVLHHTPSALDQLCNIFKLSFFERNILLLCIGRELDPNFEQLCAQAQGSLERNYPTLGLALSIFQDTSLRILSSQTPLQFWKLIEIEPSRTLTQSPLKINQRILCYIVGEPCLDDELAGILKEYQLETNGSSSLPPSHQKIAEQLIATWSQSRQTGKMPVVQLCGSEIVTKYAIASTASAHLSFKLFVISAAILPANPNELNSLMQNCWREAILSNSAILLDCDDINLADSSREFAIFQFIEGLNIPLIISTQERQRQCQRLTLVFDVNQPTHSEQRDIWQSHLGSVAAQLNGHIDRLVSQFNLSTTTIQAACLSLNHAELANQTSLEEKITELEETSSPPSRNRKSKTTNPPPPTEASPSPLFNHLWEFCRTQSRPRLEDLAQRVEAIATWDNLVLPEQQKNVLRNISIHVRQRAKVYQEWGFAGKEAKGLGISALFSGASGTGKTMAAEVLAKELRLDLYRIDLSAVVSKYIGETEKNLRRIFDAAETGGAILLFDEADALFGKRTQVKDSHDRHANVEVSYLLQRMEAYQGLAILTTNLKESLDQAFLRRIRFSIKFPFPDGSARVQIWQRIFPERTPTKKLDFNKLGNLNVAGGNIRNIALNAAFAAAEAGEPVMMKHILQAAEAECVKLERSLTDVEIRGWV
ncbi:MAG TPA: ATPase [Cyanobacteria bacterium UBA9273]|nr:ATPase [Cyanobacteria bacterium UBA9273]